MKRFLAILAFLGCLVPAFAHDEWQAFSEPFPIRDAIRFDDNLMFATDGGMRLKGPELDLLYTSEKGLEASVFFGVAQVNGVVFAVSEYGLVARYEGERWVVVNRSYLSRQARVIPGKVVSANKYLAILFEDGLAFFDTKSGTSVLQVDLVGDVSLSVYPPQDIANRNDTLFVSTIRGVYARKMDWSDLSRDFRLVDPSTWTRVTTDVFAKDPLHVVVGGVTLADTALYRNGESRIKWVFEGDNFTYLVGDDAVFRYENGNLEDITNYSLYKLGSIYEVQSIPGGGVYAVSPEGFGAISEGTFWTDAMELFMGFGNHSEAYNYRMKALSILDADYMMYHAWGQGMMVLRELGRFPYSFVAPWKETCMDKYVENYTVAVGTAPAPDKSGFLTATARRDGTYSLAYITREGDISCATGVGSSNYVGPLVARQEGDDWVVYVSARESFDAFSTGALDIIRFPSPLANAGRIVGVETKTLPYIEQRTPVDLVLDEKHDVLWMVSTTDLGYLELDADTIRKPNSANGLSGAEYSAVDVDPNGNVWVGTTNQGAYRLQRKGESFDTLLVSHYTTKNGLLSNGVHDVAIDKWLGMVWFAHDNGVTRYRRNDLREAQSFMTDSAVAKVKAYPVPYRPKEHMHLTIDNIADNARVDIYNRGGTLIRSFVGEEVAGGKVEWNGQGKNGRLVAPGVYYYVVRTSTKKERGKFLVIR
ncbi:MAG: gliding motility-associated C-terminal domain-containing protein [Fibrobacter sp.]|nr:gliding motility-associated C-terminal domain-containing protein [Fibrobacter sp.]